MAIPTIDWEYWSQPTIEPVMRVVVHFPSGTKTYDDSRLYSVDFSGTAFDSACTLFGKPSPTTGSISFIDYEQELNPTLNSELTEGIQIDLLLGLNGYYGEGQLGPNLVREVEPNEYVRYNGDNTWAIPFWTTEVLDEDAIYRLYFDYETANGDVGYMERTGTVSELFQRPASWPDYNHFAVLYPEELNVSNFAVQTVASLWQPYGTFYAQEWTYDSSGYTASVDIVDGMNELLLLDNRPDAATPGENVNLSQFLDDLISLNVPSLFGNVSTLLVPYAFYEDSQASTINKIVEALGAMLFFMPNGSIALSQHTGLYDTNITFTDDDLDSYSMQQTSAITMDSAVVYAMLPENVESSELANFSNIVLDSGDQVPFSRGRVMSVDYIAGISTDHIAPTYAWDVTKLIFDPFGDNSITYNTFKAFGHAIDGSALPVANVTGTLPYEVKDNYYIQTREQAQHLVDILDMFIDKKYRILKVSLRGCYGLWFGARVTVQSTMYSISATYVVIGIDFSYSGAVSTTLTMQRI